MNDTTCYGCGATIRDGHEESDHYPGCEVNVEPQDAGIVPYDGCECGNPDCTGCVQDQA